MLCSKIVAVSSSPLAIVRRDGLRLVRNLSSTSFNDKLKELNIVLPAAPAPKANYNIVCYAPGNMLYVSGHLPYTADGELLTGRIGPDSDGKTVKHGYDAARWCGLNIISTLNDQLKGDLGRVEQIVKVRSSTTIYYRILVLIYMTPQTITNLLIDLTYNVSSNGVWEYQQSPDPTTGNLFFSP